MHPLPSVNTAEVTAMSEKDSTTEPSTGTHSEADNDTQADADERFAFSVRLFLTHKELVGLIRLLHETVAQLTVVTEALRDAIPPDVSNSTGQLIYEMRDVRARMLQKYMR